MKRIRTFLALFVILGGLFATPVQAMATTTSGAEATGRISASSDSNQTQSTVTNTTVSSASASSKQVSPDNNENTQKASNEAGNKEAIRGPSVKAKKMLASTGQDISNNITSLSVNSTRINDGGKTTVKLNYNDSYQKIHEGDYINVTWPSSGTVYGSGYNKTIELNVDGVDVGTLTVTTSSAKIVFNSNVEDLDNVHGWAEFDIEGRNLTNTSSENTGTFSITSGSKEATVSVVKPASGTTGVFYYKTGDMNPSDTDHVRWFLNINNEKSYVDDRIFISDNIQTGQKLNLNSFDITVNGYNPNHFYGSNAIPEFEAAYPGASISVNKETGKITVVIPQSQASLNSFSIMYLTDIVDYNQKSFKNNSTAWYTEHNKEAVNGKDFNYSVSNVNANGGVDGENKTTASVTKVWNGTNNKNQPNEVKVQLYANGEKSGDEVTLNESNSWKHNWNSLVKYAHGKSITYTVKEVNVPENYKSTVSDSGTNNFVITNTYTPSTTTVSGTKTWKDNDDQDGKRPDSIKVNLLANGKVVQSKTVKASDNWKYSFTNLPEFENGKKISYTVTEDQVKDYSTTVDGYNLTNSYTPAKTSVSVTKAWNDNNNQDGSRPNEVKVQLYANGEKSGNEVTLNAANKWTHTWTELAEKSNKRTVQYSVKEVGTVKGYTSSVNGENGNFTVTNTHTPSTPNVPTNKTPNKSSRHNNPIKKIVQKIVQRILPQTGSSSETYLIAIGGVLLILLLSVILLKRKKK